MLTGLRNGAGNVISQVRHEETLCFFEIRTAAIIVNENVVLRATFTVSPSDDVTVCIHYRHIWETCLSSRKLVHLHIWHELERAEAAGIPIWSDRVGTVTKDWCTVKRYQWKETSIPLSADIIKIALECSHRFIGRGDPDIVERENAFWCYGPCGSFWMSGHFTD